MNLLPQCGFGGIEPAVDAPHRTYQVNHPSGADLRRELATQQITQHPTAREQVIQVRFVDPPHDRYVGGRHRLRLVIEPGAAQLQDPGLPSHKQVERADNHRFTLNMPASVSSTAKNNSLAQARRSWRAASSHPPTAQPATSPCPSRTRPPPKLLLLTCDLARVNIEERRQLAQRSVAPQRRKRDLRVKGRRVVSPQHRLARNILAALRQKLQLAECSDYPRHLSNNLSARTSTVNERSHLKLTPPESIGGDGMKITGTA